MTKSDSARRGHLRTIKSLRMGVVQNGAVNFCSCTPPRRSVKSVPIFCGAVRPATAKVRIYLKPSQNTSPVARARVLVVEDFPDYRRFISEVPDGLEAVQKAAQLKPDLILLDIGLPTMNGIEAARQIRNLSPESKIVFVSQETSADVVKEALSTGAWGYVVKAEAASQLLAAVEAVVSGTRFVTGLCKELLGSRLDPMPD
jgi:CheY-like chemotaxis protein